MLCKIKSAFTQQQNLVASPVLNAKYTYIHKLFSYKQEQHPHFVFSFTC